MSIVAFPAFLSGSRSIYQIEYLYKVVSISLRLTLKTCCRRGDAYLAACNLLADGLAVHAELARGLAVRVPGKVHLNDLHFVGQCNHLPESPPAVSISPEREWPVFEPNRAVIKLTYTHEDELCTLMRSILDWAISFCERNTMAPD